MIICSANVVQNDTFVSEEFLKYDQYRLLNSSVKNCLELILCSDKELIDPLVRYHQILNETYLVFLTLVCGKNKRTHAGRRQHIG